MEPTKPFTHAGLPNQLVSTDHRVGLEHFFNNLNLADIIYKAESYRVPNMTERRFQYAGTNNNNNNNNILDPSSEAAEAADLEILGQVDRICGGYFD